MVRLRSTGLVLVLTMACGAPLPGENDAGGGTAKCGPANCGGCCDAAGFCQSGTSTAFCGSSGASCNKCGSSCSNQVCVGGSSPSGAGGSGGGGGLVPDGGSSNSLGQAPSCTKGEDCPNWYCNCQSGPPVNSARCVNNRCQSGAESCPSACAAFNTCWLGTSGGGWTGGSNAGPSTCTSSSSSSSSCAYSDLGKSCSSGTGCQSGQCLGYSPSYICTKSCTTASDCPKNWSCATGTTGKVCMTGELGASALSTSTACSSIAHPDVGQACSSTCTGGFCVGQTYCSRRCDVSADCPSTWKCTSGPNFKYCAP